MAGRHSAAPDGGARRRARAPKGERAPSQPRKTAAGGGRSWKRGGLVLIASVLALFSVAGWSALSSFSAGGCDDGQTLTVAAAPEIAPVVEAAVSPDAGEPLKTSQGCGLTVRPTEPADALASIIDGNHAPDLWVPDTSAWLSRLPSSVPDRIPRSLAKTPVVLAGPSGGDRPDTWLAGLSQPGATLLDPSTTGASIGALEALHAEAVKGATSGTALSHWLVTAAQSAPDYSLGDGEILENAASGLGETSGWFPTTEQKVIDDSAEISQAGLATTVPRSGTILMDYPLVPVATDADATAASEAARLISQRLASGPAERRLQSSGFRLAAGTPTDAEGSVGAVTEIGVVQPQAAAALLNTWVSLTADARMLAVLDVSGSMEDYAGNRTRIELTRDAAVDTLQDLPVTWQLGLWAFSSRLGQGDTDYRQLVPVRELGERYGNATHRERLTAALQRLPALTTGGTGLYDTALVSYRAAVSGYDPQRFNSVLLLTDGRNDDDGISLDRLLAALRSERDPARPVRLITIGVGPDADAAALSRMAEVTGGRNYVVRDPRDLQAAFDDALLERVGWGLE